MFDKQINIYRIDRSVLEYSIITWDSYSLGNKTIEIENFSVKSGIALKKILSRFQIELKLKKGDLLFSKIPPKDFIKIQLLDQAGFYFIEEGITLDINLDKWNPNDFKIKNREAHRLVPADLSDKKKIKDIAGSTFVADRFHLDPNIPKEKADNRFEVWIENSFNSSDKVYKFIDKENVIIGFFIVNEHIDYAEFRLAGLDPHCVGQGLGKLMYYHMYRLLKEKKYLQIKSVISLNNTRVVNVYMYLTHAKFINPLIVLHKVI